MEINACKRYSADLIFDTNEVLKARKDESLSLLNLQVTTIKTVKQLDELVDMGDDSTAWHQRWKSKLINLFNQVN